MIISDKKLKKLNFSTNGLLDVIFEKKIAKEKLKGLRK